jgi:type VI secretion system protein VasI
MKFLGFIFILISFFSWTTAQTDITQNILYCTTINTSDERLACYDAVATKLTQPAQTNVGNWNVAVDTNPIDDTKTVFVTNIAEEGQGTYGDPVSLHLRCKSGVVDVIIAWNAFIADEEAQVTYRIGTNKAILGQWYTSTDNKATFFSTQSVNAKRFIGELAASDNGKFVAQITPYSESPITAVFNIVGLGEILSQLYEPCPE